MSSAAGEKMYRSALLLLTSPLRFLIGTIGNHFLVASKTVRKRLYVCLNPGRMTVWPQFSSSSEGHDLALISRLLPAVYMKASSMCRNLDVRVLLSPHKKLEKVPLHFLDLNVIMTDCKDSDTDVYSHIPCQFEHIAMDIVRLESFGPRASDVKLTRIDDHPDFSTYDTVVLGGTFDRLHNGHKVLLSCSVLRARKKVIVGVTDGDMLAKKTFSDLIEPVDKRIEAVKNFLEDIDSSLEYSVVPIYDAFGPSIVHLDIDCIVVSEETKRGGELVNAEREARGMKKLDIVTINLLEEPYLEAGDELKISSSNQRRALLGSYIKQPPMHCRTPLCIALTGELQNVKSLICKDMEEFGASVIDCDELVQSSLMSKMSSGLLDNMGDRFHKFSSQASNKSDLIMVIEKERWKKVSHVLLPEIKAAIERKIQEMRKKDVTYVVLKLPSFADDVWLSDVNQIWGIISLNSEHKNYLRTYYGLSDEEIENIIKCKVSNVEIVKKSHVVFCYQDHDDLRKQVRKAWDQLKDLERDYLKFCRS